MCSFLIIFIDCICASRVVEFYFDSSCECVEIKLYDLFVNICFICYTSRYFEFIEKIMGVYARFGLGADQLAYYEESATIFTERQRFRLS